MCVELSEEEIGEKIRGTRAFDREEVDASLALHELISGLVSRDVAMWVFMETLRDLYGSTATIESLRTTVRSCVAEPVLTRDQRRTLHGICTDLRCADATTLFKLSAGGIGSGSPSDPAHLITVLNELEELPARVEDGLHPIVVFVEFLARRQTPTLAERMRAWTDSCVGDRTPLIAALQAIRHGDPLPRHPQRSYVVVRLDIDGVEDDRYLASILFQEGSEPLEPVHRPDDQSRTEAQIRALIGGALNEPNVQATEDLLIEFFLPAQLINHPVDQWRVGLGDIALGVQYPIVVRSLDRIRRAKNAHHIWKAKWAKISDVDFSDADAAVAWLSDDSHRQGNGLFVFLTDPAAPVCLLLKDAPVPDRCGALLTALRAGVPVLLWRRQPSVDFEGELAVLMEEVGPVRLAELPWRLFQFRRAAAYDNAGRDHISNHLTLLWDDAERIPDIDTPLRMPV
jgi:hypothetical protein